MALRLLLLRSNIYIDRMILKWNHVFLKAPPTVIAIYLVVQKHIIPDCYELNCHRKQVLACWLLRCQTTQQEARQSKLT